MSGDDYQVIKLAVMGEVVVFYALDEKNIKAIARIQLASLVPRWRKSPPPDSIQYMARVRCNVRSRRN